MSRGGSKLWLLTSGAEYLSSKAWPLLLCFAIIVPMPLRAQQASLVPAEANPNGPISVTSPPASNPSNSAEQPNEEPNPAVTFAPQWRTSSDSLGNIRHQIKIENDYAIGDRMRLGLLYGQSFIHDGQSAGNNEDIRDAGVTTQWRQNERLKLNGMFGLSRTGATVNSDGQAVSQAFIPIANVNANYTSAGESARLDLGFKRSIFDLSPQLVANRVVRNDFVIHPQIGLQSGWRFRELAEIGPVTSALGNNYRYNSEFTVARKLAKNSELYSTFTFLHYAQASDAGYFSPD
ncbi:MAG: hypothetical protein ACRD3Q_06515, partial [Terriglobales bacterium]